MKGLVALICAFLLGGCAVYYRDYDRGYYDRGYYHGYYRGDGYYRDYHEHGQ